MPPHSARLTRTAFFPVGLKSIAASQSSASNSCFVSCLQSWGPEPHKLPLLCRWIEGRVQPIVSIHFVIKNLSQSKQGGAECGQACKVRHCWGVRTIQLIQQQGEQGGMSFCKLMLLVQVTHSHFGCTHSARSHTSSIEPISVNLFKRSTLTQAKAKVQYCIHL